MPTPPERTLSLSFGGAMRSGIRGRAAGYGLTVGELEFRSGIFRGGLKVLDYAWSRPDDYVVDTRGRDPWARLHEVSAGLTRRSRWNGLMVTLLAGVQSGFEEQCDNSLGFVAGAFAVYPLGPKWAFTVGVFHSRHPKVRSDLEFMPVLGVSWNARAARGPSVTLGMPRAELAWRFGERTLLALTTSSFEGGVYRLANDSPVRERGYVDLLGVSGALRLETRVFDRATAGVALSQPLYRRHTLHDRDGKNKQRYAVASRPALTVSLSLPF